MKLAVVAVGALASLVTAHYDPREGHVGIPKMLGARKFLSELRARKALPEIFTSFAGHVEAPQPAVKVKQRHAHAIQPIAEDRVEDLKGRQVSTDGQCGPGYGTCPSTQCCSLAGYCGNGIEYCAAPDCQFMYGPACDANQSPAGTSTANLPRPLLGSQPYGGVGIYDCLVPGDIAFTFDDGPYNYTNDLLDKLAVYNASATFMITGNNLGKGPIDSTPQWIAVINRMIAEGHQIASHTWSHQNLTSLDDAHFQNQMIYNEMAFRNILGYFPTYMRPPYSECDAPCEAKLLALGYHITYFDLDTEGYLNDSPTLIQNSKNIWDATIDGSNPAVDNFLEIEHDIHYQTVYNLTDYILASMYAHGYKSVTVGQCLGDNPANWYRSATTGGSSTGGGTTSTQSISTDGSCSATITCIGSTFGNCCSQYGYCGSTSDYCGTGCQTIGGTCGVSSSSSSSPVASSSTSALSEFPSSSIVSSAAPSLSSSISLLSSVPSLSTQGIFVASSSSDLATSSSISGALSSSIIKSSTLSTSTSVLSSVNSGLLVPSFTTSSRPSFSTSLVLSSSLSSLKSSISVSSFLDVKILGSTSSTSLPSPLSSTSSSVISRQSTLVSSHISVITTSFISIFLTASLLSSSSKLSSITSSSISILETSSTKISSTSTKPPSSSSSSIKSSTQSSTHSSTTVTTVSSVKSSTSSTKPTTTATSTKSSSSSKTSSTKASSTSSAAQSISTDGTCSSSITCQGSTFGNCCSQYGWCGSTSAYCGTGCKPASGSCTAAKVVSSSSSSSTPASSALVQIPASSTSSTLTTKSATPTPNPTSITISPNGSCGPNTHYTCVGSAFGNCCTALGQCGTSILGLLCL